MRRLARGITGHAVDARTRARSGTAAWMRHRHDRIESNRNACVVGEDSRWSARVERRAKDASFESLPVEVVREILMRRAQWRRGRRGAWLGVSKNVRAAVESAPRCFLRTWI